MRALKTPAAPILTRAWPWAAAVASGVLLVAAFPPVEQGWLIWIALVPLLCAVWFGGTSRPAWLGYVAGLVFFTGTFHWLGELAPLFRNVALRGLPFLLSLYMGLYLAFWAWFAAWLRRPGDATAFSHAGKNIGVAAVLACAWVAHEWVRGWLFGGFGWNALGVALHGDLAMIQIVEITGVAGLSWLVAFVNVMAVLVVRRMIGDLGPQFLRTMRWEFSATVALVALVWAYGTRTLLRGDRTPTLPLRVAAIQSNIPQREKFDPALEGEIFARFGRLTELALAMKPTPQLVLWPESATPQPLFADLGNHDFVFAQAQRTDGALLLGSTDMDEHGDDYNVAVLLTGRGENVQIHRKIHLVPFGEYLPARPILGPIAGGLVPGDFARGRERTILRLDSPEVRLSALVCFEDTLGDLPRQFVQAGAQLLVNITNDGWFARSVAARQHLVNAIFRAVENRRPLVRCANTGVTGLVQPTGYFERWVPEFQEGVAVREIAVPLTEERTFFTRHGDVLSPGSVAVVALGVASGWARRRRAAANSPVRT